MGMFDEVTCDAWLPRRPGDPDDLNSLEYQTKDLDSELYQVRINKDGSLWSNKYGEMEPLPWTGEMFFYTWVGDIRSMHDKDTNYRWIEFKATFVDGQMKDVERVT